MSKQKVLSLHGGPGSRKSTTAAGVFHILKDCGYNVEYVQEFAKDVAWEHSSATEMPKVLKAQEYVFANQLYRMRRLVGEVDIIITDSPLLLSLAYVDAGDLTSLPVLVKEAYHTFENLDVFIVRNVAYNPKGRFQTEEEAMLLDNKIRGILAEVNPRHNTVYADRQEKIPPTSWMYSNMSATGQTIRILDAMGWL